MTGGRGHLDRGGRSVLGKVTGVADSEELVGRGVTASDGTSISSVCVAEDTNLTSCLLDDPRRAFLHFLGK